MFIGRGPNRVQYFVGSFDGFQFTPDEDMLAYLNEGKGLEGELFDGFDHPDYQGWEVLGTAFGAHPVQNGPLAGLGKGYVHSDHKMSGILLSSEFIIQKSAINFLLAGSKRPGQVGIHLMVDGEKVRTATGDNTDVFRWRGWDVNDLVGKTARIAIVDSLSGEEKEFIAVDHILFSDQLMDLYLEHALWMDYGPDFYAARTWRDVDQVRNGRTTMLGWMGNWEYARIVPTSWGKGFESVPRDISLRKSKNGYRLVQQPIPELQKLRKEKYEESDRVIEGIQSLASFRPAQNCYELEAVWDVDQSASEFGLNLLVGEGRKLSLTYDPVLFNLVLDRTNCTDYTSDEAFNQKFPEKMSMVVPPENGQLRLHILVDRSSVEIFTNQGEKVMSALTFPGEDQKGIELFATEGKALLASLKAWELHSIWNKP